MTKTLKTEKDEAAWYQAHKDDPAFLDDFEEVPPPRKSRGRPSKGRATRISVRFTSEEMRDINAKAHDEGIFLSDVVRRAVSAYVTKSA